MTRRRAAFVLMWAATLVLVVCLLILRYAGDEAVMRPAQFVGFAAVLVQTGAALWWVRENRKHNAA